MNSLISFPFWKQQRLPDANTWTTVVDDQKPFACAVPTDHFPILIIKTSKLHTFIPWQKNDQCFFPKSLHWPECYKPYTTRCSLLPPTDMVVYKTQRNYSTQPATLLTLQPNSWSWRVHINYLSGTNCSYIFTEMRLKLAGWLAKEDDQIISKSMGFRNDAEVKWDSGTADV